MMTVKNIHTRPLATAFGGRPGRAPPGGGGGAGGGAPMPGIGGGGGGGGAGGAGILLDDINFVDKQKAVR